ncbi:Proton-coupled amino acid transporter 1 [Zootermopsis nevadensis]|uniref:Proton-coupled amino acid transporter 1 n=2 Tax=Zootermopsis nevadensis TaxID=136037 RepID=A0A067RCN4_ZOONE|nr:Proton-coupled amino acid transporter 1 [Zootermopsis nevadensis]
MGDAFRNAGLIAGPVVSLLLSIICVYCQHMLLTGAKELQKRTGSPVLPTFAETVELSFKAGPPQLRKWAKTVRLWINIFLCVTQMGFCCVYFVFISDNVKKVMDHYNVELDIHIHMLILLLPIMLSCWIRDLKYLVPVSLFANVFMTVGIAVTLYYISQELPTPSTRDYIAPWSKIPLFFGTAIYAFEGIGLVLPLQSEMKQHDQFTRPFGVLNIGMTIVTCLIVTVGFLGYLKYGDSVEGSLTLNLPQEDILAQAVQLTISVGVLFSYALQMYVPIEILWPRIQRRWGPFKYSSLIEIIFRSSLVLITFILAEVIPHFSLFISLVGAVSSTALALFFPAIMDIATHWESGLGPFKWVLWKDGFFILIGVIGFITGTYASVEAIVQKL